MNRFIKILLALMLMSSSFSHGTPHSQSQRLLHRSPNQASSDEKGPSLGNFSTPSELAAGLEEALTSKKQVSDPFHLVEQDLVIKGQTLPLYSLGESPLNARVDKLEYLIDGNDFVIVGKLKDKETVRHTFRGIGIHSYQADKEVLLALTHDGQVHAIDMGYFQKNVFRGPIPIYKNLVSHESFREPSKMNFWTRGLPPRIVENLQDSADSLFPHNREGQIVFQAGDLVLHRGPEKQSKAFAILSREVLTKNLQEKAEELTLRASIASADVFASMDPKVLAKMEQSLDAQITVDDLSQMALRSIPEDSVKKLLAHASQIADQSQSFDRALLDEWQRSYDLIRQQAEKNGKTLLPQEDLSQQWQQLLAEAMKNGKPATQKPGFFKKYGLLLAGLTGAATALSFSHLNETQSVMIALDYLYTHAVPPILKVAEYRYPLLASVVSLVSIVPIVQMVAWMAPSSMKTVALGLRAASQNLSQKLETLAEQWQSLNVWQRLVTAGARIYSLISVAAWNHLGTILRQPQLFRTLKLGLNPFSNIKKNSELGQQLNLEKDLSLGVNNPFLSSSKLSQKTVKQQQAMQFLTNDNLKARHLAFQLVALTLYQKQEVDPATLAMLLQNPESSESLDAALLKDLTPAKQKEWLALTEVIANDWLQTVRTEGRLFTNLPAEEFVELYKTAQKKLARYQNSSSLKKRLVIFKDRTNRFLKKVRQDTLLLGVSDGQFLRSVYASPFVADQVKKTFVSDHILVVGLPAFWGDRANPEKPFIPGGNADGTDRNLLTFKPEGGSLADFWTNPEHMMDVWINLTAHFFGGGARTILLYQGEPVTQETNYKPAEHVLMDQKQETESLVKGSTQWVKGALDTRQSALGDYYMKTLVRQIRTVQAGMLLSLTFRFLSTDPTLEMALMGWYLFFVAGTWSYAWPWTIIGQGNNLEEQRMNRQSELLRDRQTKLSQALRLGDIHEVIDATKELEALYTEKNSRQKHLLKTLGESPSVLDVDAYKKWSNTLLTYSQQTPPYATRPNPLPSWVSTWAGAFSTTFLAIPLGILSLDPHFLNAPNLAKETLESLALFGGAYVLIGKEGLWSKMLNSMEWVTTSIKERGQRVRYGMMSCRKFRY